MDDLNALVAPAIGAVVVALAVVCAVLLVLVLVLFRRLSTAEQRFAGLTRGESGRSLEEILNAHLDRVDSMGREVDELAARTAINEAAQRRAFQRIGLVRFNPFEDTGGNQSFAIALLDGAGSGVVLSSLHSRTGTRVYAKAVTDGRSDGALSEEESDALRRALATRSPGLTG